MMNARERVMTALHGGEPDRIPCALGFFAQSLFGAADADEYFGTDVRFVDFAPPPEQDSFFEYLESLPPRVHVGSAAQLRTYHEWGYRPERAGSAMAPGAGSAAARQGSGEGASPGEVAGTDGPRAPSEDGPRGVVDRIVRLLPKVTARQRHAHLRAQVERLHARGLAVAGSPPHLGGELFESAWRLRGFDRFMTDLVRRPDLVDYLLEQLEAMATESARILGKAGVDVLILDDDVAYNGGLLISPAMWRRHFKPRMARIIAAARGAAAGEASAGQPPVAAEGRGGAPGPGPAVLYHCDGDFTALLPDLMEIGVNAVNPIAPDAMDAAAIRRRLGEGLALWGTVGTAWSWDYGSPESIRDEVRAHIGDLGRKGLLLCPAYDLDFAPLENVAAFVAAVREFG